MSLIKYRVGRISGRIERFEFAKETACYYIKANGNRESKVSRYYRYFDTEAEALQHIAERQQAEKDARRLKQIEKAAPDLLAALELVTDCLTKCLTGGEVSAKLVGKSLIQASEAISRATGGDL